MIKHTMQMIGTIRRMHKIPRYLQYNGSNNTDPQNQTQQNHAQTKQEIPVASVMQKMQIAEMLLGTELEAKNHEMFEELFNPSYINKIKVEQSQKYNIQIELLILEIRYRNSRKQFDQSRLALQRYREVLIEQKLQSNNNEGEQHYWNQMAIYYEMMSQLMLQDHNNYIWCIEEGIRCRQKCLEYINESIGQLLQVVLADKHEFLDEMRIKIYQHIQLTKIAGSLEILGSMATSQEMFDESRGYFEKACEIYEQYLNENPLKYIICKLHVARSYRYTDIQKSISIINDLYLLCSQSGNTTLSITLAMQLYTYKAYANDYDTVLYEQIVDYLKLDVINDKLIIYEFTMAAIPYCYKQKYYASLEQHIDVGLAIVSEFKLYFITGITKLGKYLLKLPLLSPKRKELLQSCQNKFRSYIGTPDNDETFAKFIMIRSLIDFELIILNGTTLEEAFKTIQQSIYQIIQFQDPEVCVKLIKQTRQYLKERQFKTEEVTMLIDTTLSNYTIENCNSTHLINYIKDSLQK